MKRIGINLHATLIQYLQRVKTYQAVRFIVEFAFLSLVIKILLSIIIGWGYETLTGANFANLETPIAESDNLYILFIVACLFTPLIETFFLNLVPIYLINKLTNNSYLLILISSIIFSLVHISYDYIYPVIIFPLAFVLSFGFVMKMKESYKKAFGVTALMHALHNLMSIAFFMLIEW